MQLTGLDSEGVAEIIRLAAERLNYQPNLTASNLRRGDGKSATIGLLVQDVSNPYSAAIYRAVEDVAGSAGVACAGAAASCAGRSAMSWRSMA